MESGKLSASLSEGTVRRNVNLDEDNTRWLERTYGDRNLSNMLNLLIASFRKQHAFTLDQLAELGAAELKKDIVSGSVDTESSEPPIKTIFVEPRENQDPPVPESKVPV